MQTMLKMISGILRLFVLLVVSMALVGVNIVQLSCLCCDTTYLQVELLPQEKACLCGEGEACHAKACCPVEKENSRHDFYKVAGFSQLVKNMLPDIMSFYLAGEVAACVVPGLEYKSYYILCPQKIPDLPPSPELLCTYLC